MNLDFSGADTAGAAAYLAAAEAVVRLQLSTDELEARLEQCSGFVVGHAYAAFMMSLAGAAEHAARRAELARDVHVGVTRRERELIEILLLSVDGDHMRAAALAAEHIGEFPADAKALTTIDRWFRERETG